MKFDLIATGKFDRQLKRLAKKHSSLKKDLAGLFESLETEPQQGDTLGLGCYKIRLAIAVKTKENRAVGALLLTFRSRSRTFTCCLFKTSQRKIAWQMES